MPSFEVASTWSRFLWYSASCLGRGRRTIMRYCSTYNVVLYQYMYHHNKYFNLPKANKFLKWIKNLSIMQFNSFADTSPDWPSSSTANLSAGFCGRLWSGNVESHPGSFPWIHHSRLCVSLDPSCLPESASIRVAESIQWERGHILLPEAGDGTTLSSAWTHCASVPTLGAEGKVQLADHLHGLHLETVDNKSCISCEELECIHAFCED